MTAKQLYHLADRADWNSEVTIDGKEITGAALIYDVDDNVRLELRTKEKD